MCGSTLKKTTRNLMGRAVAEWSNVMFKREKINKNRKIPGSPPPGQGNLKRTQQDIQPS